MARIFVTGGAGYVGGHCDETALPYNWRADSICNRTNAAIASTRIQAAGLYIDRVIKPIVK
jgi:nucleoside-diphosphate-sugar epimerase